ncbi:MAG: Gfo/Idh/MocA family protein [Burkholderiales bacterium]
MKKLRAAVIGVGYLGTFHVQKFAALDDVELVGVVDIDREKADAAAAKYGVTAYDDYRRILDRADMVSVVVPTEHHYRVARDCLEAGLHILVEKPVTQSVAEANHLIELSRARGRVFQVGHLERFNPAITALHGVLNNPQFIESHRLSPFKARGIDVSVILDLMIHDIDLIVNMVRSEITAIRSTGLPVLTDEVDIANARIEFANGCVANVTASRVSQAPVRKIRIFQPDAYMSIDLQEHKLSIYRKNHNRLDAGGRPRIEVDEQSYNQADSLMLEIRAFVDAVQNGTPPIVSGEDGRRALQIALEVSHDMPTGAAVRHTQVS